MVEYLGYFFGPALYIFGMWQFAYTSTMFPLLWVFYALIPMLDYFSALDVKNRTPEEYEALEKDCRYLIPLYTVWVTDFWMLFWAFNVIYY